MNNAVAELHLGPDAGPTGVDPACHSGHCSWWAMPRSISFVFQVACAESARRFQGIALLCTVADQCLGLQCAMLMLHSLLYPSVLAHLRSSTRCCNLQLAHCRLAHKSGCVRALWETSLKLMHASSIASWQSLQL